MAVPGDPDPESALSAGERVARIGLRLIASWS
jgi:hypothetical protein